MHDLAVELGSISRNIWSVVLGLELDTSAGAPSSDVLAGVVRITGAWEGAVVLRCDRRVAARAAAILFGVDPAHTTPEQENDVLGELTNVVGGNLKALLPQPSRLSLPIVHSASGPELEGTLLADVALSCQGDAVRVQVTTVRG